MTPEERKKEREEAQKEQQQKDFEKGKHNPADKVPADSTLSKADVAKKKAVDETKKVVTGKEYNQAHPSTGENDTVVPEEATRVSGVPGKTYSTTPAGFEATTQTLPKYPTARAGAVAASSPLHNPAPQDHLDRSLTTSKADLGEAAEVDQHDEKAIPRGQTVTEQFTSPKEKEDEKKRSTENVADTKTGTSPGVPRVDPSLPPGYKPTDGPQGSEKGSGEKK